MLQRRVAKELQMMEESPPPGIFVWPKENHIDAFEACINQISHLSLFPHPLLQVLKGRVVHHTRKALFFLKLIFLKGLFAFLSYCV
jgi:hypothetical protein